LDYAQLGKDWLAGNVRITTFGRFKLTPKQIEYVNAKDRHLLVSGGRGCGKTMAFIVKMYLLAQMFPGIHILLARKTRSNIEQTTLPDVFDVFPPGTYEYKVGAGKIHFPNGSLITIKGLDASTSGEDTKKAAQDIKGMNLGAAFLDQLEEISEDVYDTLDACVRQSGMPFHQLCGTTNPANYWGYGRFKATPMSGYRLIEASMLDNKENLPEDFVASQMAKGESWVRKYVHGEWSPDSMTEGAVFDERSVRAMEPFVRAPIRTLDGVKIFAEPRDEVYQIGVDPSIGTADPCGIKVVSCQTGEEVASYSAFVPTKVIADKVSFLSNLYSEMGKPLVVPESTGVGQALVEELRKRDLKLYVRESFNSRTRKKTDKYGFATTYSTKMQLIEHARELFSQGKVRVREKETVDELKVFRYDDAAKKAGAGAPDGFHDDRVMALLLALWNVKPSDGGRDRIADEIRKAVKTFRRVSRQNPAR
jgi:hypothetical protein